MYQTMTIKVKFVFLFFYGDFVFVQHILSQMNTGIPYEYILVINWDFYHG